MEAVNHDEGFQPVPLHEVDEVVDGKCGNQSYRGRHAERDSACGDRRFLRRFLMAELHRAEELLLLCPLRPVCGVVLRGFEKGADIEDRFHVRVIHVLLDEIPADLDGVHSKEDVSGEQFSLPSFRVEFDVRSSVRIDRHDDVPERFDLRLSDVVFREHLVRDVVRFDDVEIPQGHLGYAASGEILREGRPYGPASDDMDAGLNVPGVEEFIGLGKIHDFPLSFS